MPLTPTEKDDIWDNHGIKCGNLIRSIERAAVDHDSHRSIEVKLNCLHQMLNELGVALGITPDEADLNPSVYGENGGK